MELSVKAKYQMLKMLEGQRQFIRISMSGYGQTGPRATIVLDEHTFDSDVVEIVSGINITIKKNISSYFNNSVINYRKDYFGKYDFFIDYRPDRCL